VPDAKLAGKIVGHELAGEVVEVGDAVSDLAVGDRVVIETVLGDNSCDWCRVEQYNLCSKLYEVRAESVSRAFAEYVVGPAKKFRKLPDNVSFEEAALLDTFSVSLHAIHITGLKVNDKEAVLGAGPIGLAELQLAKLLGTEVLVTDVLDYPLDLARQLGADAIVNTKNEDIGERVKDFTNGRGVDAAFECAGGDAMPVTLRQATEITRAGGKVAIVGGFDEEPSAITLDWQHIQKAEIQLLPSASYAFWSIYPEMQICIDLLAAGKIDAKSLITHRFPLVRINDAFETADDKKNTNAVFVALLI
jgi:L-iditol 2-dehydrogenase